MATWAIPSAGSGYRLVISQSQQSNDPSSDTSRAQEELYKLIGTSSGFIEAQPPAVRRRIAFLEELQEEHDDLQEKFEVEMRALEKKYSALQGARPWARRDCGDAGS